jgi:Type ISP C-terminal specificity domain
MMRRSLLSNFHAVWIDNLNGDKYRTGKIIPKGLPGAGTRDNSAFTTEMDPRGIQPGTAIATWVKRIGARTKASNTAVVHRDFWGPAAGKRQGLLASLPDGSPRKVGAAPVYEVVKPSRENRWRLGPKTVEGGFEAWPGLDEIFPTHFQGVNHNRGLEGGIIDTDRAALGQRLRPYFAAENFRAAKKVSEEIATARARYDDPEKVWLKLKTAGHFPEDAIVPLLTFPFDRRYIYYVGTDKWLNEARQEFARNASDNEWLVTVPEPRKASETWPVFSNELVNLHVHERGSVIFPRETRGEDLLADRDANIPEATWRVLREHFGLKGERRDGAARGLMGKLFRVAFAVLHARSYQAEHKSALSFDWAHLPIPKDVKLFDRLVSAGEQVTRLLDAARDASDVIRAVVGADRARARGPLKRIDGKHMRPDDLKVTVTYWGGGKGRWKARPFMAEELPAADYGEAWGERTGDLFLNDDAYFGNVPEVVWGYQLGGYPVLKKWLSYRQADRRDGRPLTDDERQWFRQIIQRVAALLALGPALNEFYEQTAANAFTAEELQIAR